MIDNFINILKSIEDSLFVCSEECQSVTYGKYGNLYIKSGFDKNSPLFINNEIQLYPSLNYKLWGVWLLKIVRIKKSSISLERLLGLYLSWPFLKKYKFSISADIIFYRFHNAIMLYDKLANIQVIKLALTDWGKVKIKTEKEAIVNALKINHNKVLVPKIKYYQDNEHYNYFLQDFFVGRQLSYKDDLIHIFNNVFEFLICFYASNGVELKSLKENTFLNHAFVEEYIHKQKNGKEVVEVYKRLLNKDKKMLWGWVHGDLSHHNILFDDKRICLIDWGKSKFNYLAVDLDISSFNTEAIFKQLIIDAGIDSKQLYTLNEQIFLKRFAEMNRLVHNGIKRKTISSTFYKWVETQNKILLSIEL